MNQVEHGVEDKAESVPFETNEGINKSAVSVTEYFAMRDNSHDDPERWLQVRENFATALTEMSAEGDSDGLRKIANTILESGGFSEIIDNNEAMQGVVDEGMLAKYFESGNVNYERVGRLLSSGVVASEAMTNSLIESLDFDSDKGMSTAVLDPIVKHLDTFPNVDRSKLYEYISKKKDGLGVILNNRDKFPDVSDEEIYTLSSENNSYFSPRLIEVLPGIATDRVIADCIESDPMSLQHSFRDPDVYVNLIDDGKADLAINAITAFRNANSAQEVPLQIDTKECVERLKNYCFEEAKKLTNKLGEKYSEDAMKSLMVDFEYPTEMTEKVLEVMKDPADQEEYLRFAKLYESSKKFSVLQ